MHHAKCLANPNLYPTTYFIYNGLSTFWNNTTLNFFLNVSKKFLSNVSYTTFTIHNAYTHVVNDMRSQVQASVWLPYIWRLQTCNWHLGLFGQTTFVQNKTGCALVKIKTSNDDTKCNNTTTQQPNLQMVVFHVCQPSYLCVSLRFGIRYIGGWKCPKFMHKSKYIFIS